MLNRVIIHVDLDAFFCAVEEQRNPALRGTPFAVGGSPESRGVVSSCSYPARLRGVHSAMPMGQALRLCPELTVVSGHYAAYEERSSQVMELLLRYTPMVEQISIDEAFLDVSHYRIDTRNLAERIKNEIRDELSLPCSLGVATNKLVAKIATDVGKASIRTGAYPTAITIVAPGKEAVFLSMLPIRSLWGIGPKSAEVLESRGIRTIGEIAERSEDDLEKVFGKTGRDLVLRARGVDNRPVICSHRAKSISQELTFSSDQNDLIVLRGTLRDLSDQVGRRLRKSKYTGTTVRLKLRWPDFRTISRQKRLANATDSDDIIFSEAVRLFQSVWTPGRSVRLIGVGMSGLLQGTEQLMLWHPFSKRDVQVQQTLDDVRDRFGERSIYRGIGHRRANLPMGRPPTGSSTADVE